MTTAGHASDHLGADTCAGGSAHADTNQEFGTVGQPDKRISTGTVIHNSNQVTVVVNPGEHESEGHASLPHGPTRRAVWVQWPARTRWTIGTAVSVAIVGAGVLGTMGGEPAPTPAAAVRTPATTAPAPTTTTVSTGTPVTSSDPTPPSSPAAPPEPGGSAEPEPKPSATPSAALAPPPVPAFSAGSDTDPAVAVPGGHCKRVIGEDVRVFADRYGTEQTWTQWRGGTLFWAVVGSGTPDRYATSLRNGQTGWVTKDTRYVADGEGCP